MLDSLVFIVFIDNSFCFALFENFLVCMFTAVISLFYSFFQAFFRGAVLEGPFIKPPPEVFNFSSLQYYTSWWE